MRIVASSAPALLTVLYLATGCVNVRVPDVYIDASAPTSGPARRYTPYGRELDKVVRRQAAVSRKLQERNWEDLNEELSEWTADIRKLAGRADTSKNPARMREYTSGLLAEVKSAQQAAAARNAQAAARAVDRTDVWLDRLSQEFPVTEPAP